MGIDCFGYDISEYEAFDNYVMTLALGVQICVDEEEVKETLNDIYAHTKKYFVLSYFTGEPHTRGRELSKSAFPFSNTLEGFQSAKDWAVKIAVANDKKQIVLGFEPTGHYWFCLATWMISNGISVVQVNPYAVKQTKELEDNSQLKDDTKDPKLIANLVKDGNFGMPYLPEKLYADLRRLSMFREHERIVC